MGGRKKGKCRKLNPKAKEFIPSVISACDGKYTTAAMYSSYIPYYLGQSTRPHLSKSHEELSFSFLESDDESSERKNCCVDFVSEMPTLVIEKIFKFLDVTNIQICRKVSHKWNDIIIKLQPNVIKDIESDAAFLKRMEMANLSSKSPVEPFYLDISCATCWASKSTWRWDLESDVTWLLAYQFDCEDNSKKLECDLCPDWKSKDKGFDNYTDDEEDAYYKQTGDTRTQKIKLFRRQKRSQIKHFAHIILSHEKEWHKFLVNQKLIPLFRCGTCDPDEFFGYWEISMIFHKCAEGTLKLASREFAKGQIIH